MHQLIPLILVGLVLISPAVSAAIPDKAPQAATTTEVIGGNFGLFNLSEPSKPAFVPAKVVPLAPNQAYGWIIRLRTDKAKIKWREEFTLPVKPATWGDPEPLGTRTVSNDGRTSITEREVAPERGVIFNSWTVAPGDPKGHYVIRVFVEGMPAKTFEFELR